MKLSITWALSKDAEAGSRDCLAEAGQDSASLFLWKGFSRVV